MENIMDTKVKDLAGRLLKTGFDDCLNRIVA
jgi:hypothetical protein